MKAIYKIYIESFRGLAQPSWLLAIVMLINRTGSMVLPFMGVYITHALGYSIREAGLVLSCFGLGAVTGAFLGGWLTDRFGNFWVQLISLLLSVPLFIAVPQFTNIHEIALVIFILSVVSEVFRPANSVAVARYAPKDSITRAFSLNRMAVNLGFSIGPALGGFLASVSYGWIFYGNAIGAFIAAIVFAGFFYKTRKQYAPRKKNRVLTTAERRKLSPYRDKLFLIFGLLCSLYAICFFQLLNTLPLFYQKIHLLNEKQIGYILAFSGIIVVIFEMFLVYIAERRLSVAASIAIGVALCAVSFSLLIIPKGIIMLYISIFILSISEILAMPFMASVAVQRAPKATQGAYMGLNALAFSMAHIFSPYLGTFVADKWGFATLWISVTILLVLLTIAFYKLVPLFNNVIHSRQT